MKVVYTKQSNVDMYDFDFLTEANPIHTNNRYWNADSNSRDYPKSSKSSKDKKSEESANKLINMMNRLGNSISEMFKWIWDQIKRIPELMGRIGGYLKDLWGKIKGWCTRFHIVDRTKTLSRLTIACIGFVSSLILICIHGIPGVEPEDSHIPYYIDRLKHPEKYMSNPGATGAAETPQEEKKEKNETAVFIETLDMILREDSNGGVFMAIARKAIEKGKKIANAVCMTYRNSKNSCLKNLVGTLRTFVYGSSAALKGSMVG